MRGGGRGGRLRFFLVAENALLQAPKLVVLALLCQQLFVGAPLHDLAVIHDQDEVTIPDGREAVGDDQHRAVCKLVVDHIKDGILCAKVQTAGGFVQNIEVRILQEGPGQSQTLLLAAREAVAGFLEVGIVLQRQLPDELVGICLFGSGLDLIEAGFRSGNADVVVDGLAEQLDVLGNIGDGTADRGIAVLVQRDTAHADGTVLRLIILEQELGDGGFAAAAAAHEGHLLAIGDGEGDVAQGRGTAAVAEGDIPEFNITVDLFHLGVFPGLVLLGLVIHDLGQTLDGDLCLLDGHLQADQLADRRSKVRGKGAERHITAQRHLTIQHLHDTDVGRYHAEDGGDEGGDKGLHRANLAGAQAYLQSLDVLPLQSLQLPVFLCIALDRLDAAQTFDHLAVQDGRLLHRLFVDPLEGLLEDEDEQDAQQGSEDGDGEKGGIHPEEDDGVAGRNFAGLAGGEELHGQPEDVPEVAQHQRDVDLDGQIDEHPLPHHADKGAGDAD